MPSRPTLDLRGPADEEEPPAPPLVDPEAMRSRKTVNLRPGPAPGGGGEAADTAPGATTPGDAHPPRDAEPAAVAATADPVVAEADARAVRDPAQPAAPTDTGEPGDAASRSADLESTDAASDAEPPDDPSSTGIEHDPSAEAHAAVDRDSADLDLAPASAPDLDPAVAPAADQPGRRPDAAAACRRP
ncbi:MAG: hypothetical protein H6703_00670 [Myxococcales bacterium]|nr:hypothetical protein [Myxococcales bacterium]